MKTPIQSEDRIKARFEVFNEKRRRQFQSVSGSALLPQELEMMLEDQLHITLFRRDNPLPLFKVQMSMLSDVVTSEQAIALYKKAKRERERECVSKQEKDRLAEELRGIDREIHFHRAICRAIRDIGDGIAWRLFDYERVTLALIADRPASKHINLGGLEPELMEFSRAFDSVQGTAVLNDLTNFLKLGDVTIRNSDGAFELVEVKAGHKSSGRITRQKQDLHRTVASINTGKIEDENIIVSDLEVNLQSYLPNIGRLIHEAEKTGIASERIGEFLLVQCTDFEKASDRDFEQTKLMLDKGRECTKKWTDGGDFVVDLASQDKYMDVKNYAPFSIYPLPEKTRVRLMIGSLFLVSYLNLSAVLRYIEERGWKVVKTPEEHAEEYKNNPTTDEIWLATVRKGPLTTAIPFHLFGRIGFEFLKPKSLVDILEARLSAGPTDVAKYLANLSGEAELWD